MIWLEYVYLELILLSAGKFECLMKKRIVPRFCQYLKLSVTNLTDY